MFSWCVDIGNFCPGRGKRESLSVAIVLAQFPPTLFSDVHCFFFISALSQHPPPHQLELVNTRGFKQVGEINF